ncbi:MAG: CoA transferase, partial [Rhodanobacteraceae bacterium]
KPALVYGRMTGWGQSGPLAGTAGHDLDYIAISGALHAIGGSERPMVPLNLVGDFGGGGLLLAFGVACALLEARCSGNGQVVDAAMSDGAALLSSMIYGLHADGSWSNRRRDNLLDGGAHFYDTYECADGKFIALASLEPRFYKSFLERAQIADPEFTVQLDRAHWPTLKRKLEALFKTRARGAWCELLEGTDTCFAPVLDWDEAPRHPHNRARGAFMEIDGVTQPAPAPHFSRSVPDVPRPPAETGANTTTILADWGIDPARIAQLERDGAI